MNSDQIVSKYPHLFQKVKHIDCGPGWYDLIDKLCSVIMQEVEYMPAELSSKLYISQIKEKFGALRFYMEESTPYIVGAIRMAEWVSYTICEECGARGTARHSGWTKVLCDEHHANRESNKRL
jgi:hypothetical protein